MACIMCLAVIAAVVFSAGVGIEEWLASKLSALAKSGDLTHVTESVATWRGDFSATLDDGTIKTVKATIRLYKDAQRVSIQLDDHSLTEAEAQRLEDEICAALEATVVERRYPLGEPEHDADHEHEEPQEVLETDELTEAEVEALQSKPERRA